MTREEFIDRYIANSDGRLSPSMRREWGVQIEDDIIRIALPCACGEASCQGWAMIQGHPDTLALHFRLNYPWDKYDATPPASEPARPEQAAPASAAAPQPEHP